MSILKKFRELMVLKNLNVYVLPRTDQHQSQYLCPCDQRVSFISGFTGSNAIAVISQEQALLWTDGRYFLQAEKELLQGWKLKKMIANQKTWFQHISQNYPKQTIVGIDSRLITAQSAIDRIKILNEKGINIKAQPINFIDQVWQNKPPSSGTNIFIHQEWAGKSITEKVNWIRNKIKQKNGKAALFSDLSEIAWIVNLRSGQIPYNPFFKSILIIREQNGTLYLPKGHISLNDKEVIEHLSKQKIQIAQYQPKFDQKTLIQKKKLNHYIYSSLVDPIEWDGIDLYRAVRDQKQMNGFRRCHLSDAIAMAKFWSWRSKLDVVNQYKAAQYLDNQRFKQQHNKGLSFTTISGGGPNAAVIHYHPTQTNNSDVQKDMIHLVDSGGQYLDGTTDVTRTFHFGEPTPEQKDSFTRVLLGNLDLERVRWPKSVSLTGADVDILARRHLWNNGLDYCHGTGHGVGYFQGVHEGPVGISKYNQTVFQPGMIVTNEPGYYEDGKYGIRIQNMLLVRQDLNGVRWFQNLTLCPYDINLIDLTLLNQKDKDFINNYHKRVFQMVSPKLQGDNQTIQWLRHATRQI